MQYRHCTDAYHGVPQRQYTAFWTAKYGIKVGSISLAEYVIALAIGILAVFHFFEKALIFVL